MSDNIEHLILEQLRQLREHQEHMMGEIRELKIAVVALSHHKSDGAPYQPPPKRR
jgi:hypothetical protein